MSPLRRFAYRLRSPLLAAFTARAIERDGLLPRPTDGPRVHAMGANPDRLLLVGGTAVEGLGVATHELALAGHLARRVSALTGRGVDLDVLARPMASVAQLIDLLAGVDLARYDALILMPGEREVATLEPRSIWTVELMRLFDLIERSASSDLRTFVIEIPNLPDLIDLPNVMARQITRQAVRLNAATERAIADRAGFTVVPFVPVRVLGRARYARTEGYDRWAEVLAPPIVAGLPLMPTQRRFVAPVDEPERQAALDRLAVVGTDPDERYDRLVRIARDALGVSGAALNFIDHERQWTKAAVAVDVDGAPRIDAFCGTTIQRAELFVVEDTEKDPAFAHNPLVIGPQHIRFYAGYPIEAPHGEWVGALCVTDTVPRRFSSADAAILRELALRAQDLVWADAEADAALHRSAKR